MIITQWECPSCSCSPDWGHSPQKETPEPALVLEVNKSPSRAGPWPGSAGQRQRIPHLSPGEYLGAFLFPQRARWAAPPSSVTASPGCAEHQGKKANPTCISLQTEREGFLVFKHISAIPAPVSLSPPCPTGLLWHRPAPRDGAGPVALVHLAALHGLLGPGFLSFLLSRFVEGVVCGQELPSATSATQTWEKRRGTITEGQNILSWKGLRRITKSSFYRDKSVFWEEQIS